MDDNWSDEELKAAVIAYLEMHTKENSGIPFVKKRYYAQLSHQFGRSEKAFEYRMQNISYVFSLLGRGWVTGLKPAKNVGAHNIAIIENWILELEGQPQPHIAEFESQVISYKRQKNLVVPEGIDEPTKNYSTVTSYSRDPKVKAWVLKHANGYCECCGEPAPFTTADGEPFLEVHHIKRLADRGSDKITNTVALCPNCHRKLHYGLHQGEIVQALFEKVDRLIKE